jgi:predicted phage terminase large subunit-like protein
LTRLQTVEHQKTIEIYTNWLKTARPKQLPKKGDWNIWLILAGRGWGKTRTGAHDIINYALKNNDTVSAVIAPTYGDLKRVIFEGVSGLTKIIPPELYKGGSITKGYNSSAAQINLYNGSKIIGFTATEPDRLRGSQFHRAWCDELAAWRYPESFDQLMFCLRLGNRPQCVITTTPKPTRLIKTLVARDDAYIVTGNTFENADNLAESALESFRNLYEGTTLGRQELYAEIVENIEGALWTYDQLENIRINKSDLPDMNRIVVAIDPAMTANSSSDETGIIIAGRFNNRYYVIDDVSGKYTADGWARKAIECYYKYKADKIIAETNNGGDMVEHTLRTVDKNISYKKVTATRGKMLRAEPIHALYEQKKVYHVGVLSQLETQMTSYTGETKESPDRLDALVWALTELNTSSGNAIWRIN